MYLAEAEKIRKLEWLRIGIPPPKNQNTNKKKENIPKGWIKKSKFQRMQRKQKKQKVNVIFNYSQLILTPAMESLLNRGLNFAITPLKLNLTQVLVDYQKFERRMI